MKLMLCLLGLLSMLLSAALYAEEEAIETEVTVETAQIIRTTLHRYVKAYGLIEPEVETHGKPAASAKLAAPLAGLLQQVHGEEGQLVKKGQVLFELDSRSNEALIAKAEVAVEFTQKNFARKQQLNNSDNISRKLYDEAELQLQNARKDLLNARTQRELLQIKAPLSGTLTAIHVKVGEAVNPTTVLAELIDLERLNIALRVPSQEAVELRLGQKVEITTSTWLDATHPDFASLITVQISYISAQIDPLTDTVLVRASLPSKTGLRTGQFVHSRISVEDLTGRLAVPLESVVSKEGVTSIAVVDGDTAKFVPVKTGLRDGKLVEVTAENLQAGIQIVAHGSYGLPHDTRIRVSK
jgi:membrane fusion protein (multidrug efflux system)